VPFCSFFPFTLLNTPCIQHLAFWSAFLHLMTCFSFSFLREKPYCLAFVLSCETSLTQEKEKASGSLSYFRCLRS
jgi:hypothetical protein